MNRHTLPTSILAALEPTPDATLLLDIDALMDLHSTLDVIRHQGGRRYERAIATHCKEYVALQRRIATTRAQTSAGARAKLEAFMIGQSEDTISGESMWALPTSAIADALRLLT